MSREKWRNQSRCGLGELTRIGPRNQSYRALDGVEIPMGKGNFGGCLAHLKALGISALAI